MAFQLSQGIKNIYRSKLYLKHTHQTKSFCSCYTFEGLRVVPLRTEHKKLRVYLGLYNFSLNFQRREDQINTTHEKFIFLHVDSQFEVPQCKFIMKNSSSKCRLCFHLFFWRIKSKFWLQFRSFFNPLVSNAPLLYHVKTSENL